MIRPCYKFELTATYGSTVYTSTVYPIYKNDLSINWDIEQDEQYYRGKLNGKLKFVGSDFVFINSKNFETEFELRIFISYNAGESYSQYWTGRFWKTDCDFDLDNKIITVTPETYDDYSSVVAGLEKEYDLIDLAPELGSIQIDKRPMLQVYSPGESTIACFLSGMYWEQDCSEISDETELVDTYRFSLCSGLRECAITNRGIFPDVRGVYSGSYSSTYDDFIYSRNGYQLARIQLVVTSTYSWTLTRQSDGVVLWSGASSEADQVQLYPVSGSGAYGQITINVQTRRIYSRLVLDVNTILGLPTYPLPAEDLVENNRNYRRCIGYNIGDIIFYSTNTSTSPTKWGIYQPGIYYREPIILGIYEFYPVAKSTWTETSVWFAPSAFEDSVESAGRKTYTLKDATKLSSAISVLLAQIAPGVSHDSTSAYSQFLYGTNPLVGGTLNLYITPKSNILAGEYDQPAQKAPVTLRTILNMLRDCFRLYWFIDRDGNGNVRFRIEHISYFMNGGTYYEPANPLDLTVAKETRNGKPWSFGTSKYSYDKVEMPERYEFGWMDDVTDFFEGFPMNINSKFVKAGNIEKISVDRFTSDVDYMLLNPGACDQDGFALLIPTLQNNVLKLPYQNFERNNTDHYVQNALASFYYLQQFYLYDMPSLHISAECYLFDGEVYGVKKQKTQELQFPAYTDPDLYKFIKTDIGTGQIEKLSINLLSRRAKVTLRYDTE